jgi:glycosyltransferase involved in cell wall biosynthesis
MRKSVAFYYKNGFDSKSGGVQSVSLSLANEFRNRNYTVFLISEMEYDFDQELNINHVVLTNNRKKSLSLIKELIAENKIELIINQEGLSNRAKKDMLKVFTLYHCRLVSFIHNDPRAPIYDFTYKLFKNNNILDVSFFRSIVTFLYFVKHRRSYRDLVEYSSKTIVLAESYGSFISDKCNLPLHSFEVIPNPVKYNCIVDMEKKDIVLYVGRLNISQKRVDSLLRIWHNVELENVKATLRLIGGGDDSIVLKDLSRKLRLERTEFEGFKDPKEDYSRAKVLCLTSAFEGFPLVLYEALKFGVVPIVFDTFSSAKDIIIDGYNGRIIDKGDEVEFKNAILEVLRNYKKYFENIEEFQKNIPTVGMIYDRIQG